MKLLIIVIGIFTQTIDPREVRLFFSQPQYALTMDGLVGRLQLLRDAPLIGEAWRFPSRDACNEACFFNRLRHQWLTERLPVDHLNAGPIQEAIRDINFRYRVWENMRDAQQAFYFVDVRRLAMKRVRDLIGEEAFYAGRWPGWVPEVEGK